ncbi:MAG: hypothetical protein Q8L48_36255 [Archangium sp.]|nr:hypothetical protein [Archangium sp.]
MEAIVIALPPEAPPARLGERFTLREGTPLRVGPGREARLRLGPLGAGDLFIGTEANSPFVRVTPPTLRASLCGHELFSTTQVPVREGDSLYVHPGLVLEFRNRPTAPQALHHHLESLLSASDSDDTWAVYRDQLEEAGDPLGAWLGEAAWADDAARRRQLLGLAESVRGHLADVTWNCRGMLSSLTLSRQAVTGAPGLAWHLSQLARLPVARMLPRLAIALFNGPATGRAFGGEDPDTLAALTLERLGQLDGAPALRSVSLGFVSHARAWPRAEAAWQRLRERAPKLDADWRGVVVSGGRAMLSLLSRTPDVETVLDDVVLNPLRTDVGTSTGALVRLVGVAPQVACTLFRSVEGQWVVFDESADPFRLAHGPFALRVNGAVTARAALAPGDVVEPVEGLRFLFNFSGA